MDYNLSYTSLVVWISNNHVHILLNRWDLLPAFQECINPYAE